jgi:hypothetical protein
LTTLLTSHMMAFFINNNMLITYLPINTNPLVLKSDKTNLGKATIVPHSKENNHNNLATT